MNLQEMLNNITTLGGQIRAKAALIGSMASQENADMAKIQAEQAELDSMNARMKALQTAYDTERAAQAGTLQPAPTPAEPTRDQKSRLASNEYARAFAYALKHGINPRNAFGNEKVKILMDALTEGGGTTPGEDGGFLVPEDIDHQIREKMRQLKPLADLFAVEEVTAPTGWRVTDTAPTTGLVAVNEMGSIDDDDDQPAFAKVAYECAKYALILPISNELLTDNVANLFGYVSTWFAKKQVITENTLLVTALRTLTATNINSDPLKGLKKAVNVTIDPAHAALGQFIMNQSSFQVLDELLDGNDRPLLQPDPTNATAMRLLGLPVNRISKATMADVSAAAGQTAGTSDIFVGHGPSFATLFRCGGFQLDSTNIGGSAWRTDSTEVRGITRLGVSKFDAAAMVRLLLNV